MAHDIGPQPEINKDRDRLSDHNTAGFSTAFDWKSSYVDHLAEDGYERFSQYSATPDSTLMFAGPARFQALTPEALTPIGLVDGISMSSNPSLARLFEIGSNRSFFTRGKTTHSITLGKMLADQQNILAALSRNAFRPPMNNLGTAAAGAERPNPNIMMNLDSETFAVPFGLLLLFKTRGGDQDAGGSGKILTATYLEYCMFANYNFSIASSSPVIVESVAIEYDRPVPVSFA